MPLYFRNDLVRIIATQEIGAVLSCSTHEVIVLTLSGQPKVFKLKEVESAN